MMSLLKETAIVVSPGDKALDRIHKIFHDLQDKHLVYPVNIL